MRLLQKLAENNLVDTIEKDNEPEFRITRRAKVNSQSEDRELESKEVVRMLVEKTSEEVLMQTTLRRKKVFQREG